MKTMTKALIFYDLFWNDNRSIKLTLVVATKNYFYFGHPFNMDIIKNCARATKFKLYFQKGFNLISQFLYFAVKLKLDFLFLTKDSSRYGWNTHTDFCYL